MLKSTLLKATEAGANELKRFFNGSFKISHKEGINNLVTEADHAAEKAIINKIKQDYPDHLILSEESGASGEKSEYRWIIDPIDGTVNFANGIPICCVSVAVEHNGMIVLGAVYNPLMNEFFFAQKGFGATLNENIITVSGKSNVLESCLVTGFPYTYLDQPNGPLQVFEKLIRQGIPVRRLGSAAIDLCWVAAGRFDGFYEHKLAAWDSAAGFLMVEEAGGKVTDFEGNYYSPYQPHILATNGRIHDELAEYVRGEKLMERTEISDLGEFGLIDHLTRNIEIRNESTILGVGDDGAIIDHSGRQTVISTDMLIEGIHFDLMYTPLKHLGYKSVIVNLSDIYAMNAQPTQITLSIAFSNRFSLEALDEFYEGVYAACNKYNVDLVGGDTTSSQKGLIISITALGEVALDKFVKRSGAKKGDLVCVSGDLGSAFLGLTLLEREKKVFLETKGVHPDLENQTYIVGRLLKPEARRDIIEFFASNEIMPTAMIDVSDGLSSEVLHICKNSGTGCVIYEEKIPVNDQARQFAYTLEIDPTACALSGGEDYELLFTLDQNDHDKIVLNEQISVIGYITDDPEEKIIVTKGGSRHKLTAQGWNAFN